MTKKYQTTAFDASTLAVPDQVSVAVAEIAADLQERLLECFWSATSTPSPGRAGCRSACSQSDWLAEPGRRVRPKAMCPRTRTSSTCADEDRRLRVWCPHPQGQREAGAVHPSVSGTSSPGGILVQT